MFDVLFLSESICMKKKVFQLQLVALNGLLKFLIHY